MTTKTSKRVWLISHVEFCNEPDDRNEHTLNEHVSSTLARAERFISERTCSPYSWWEVRTFAIDCKDRDVEEESIMGVRYYSHRGTPLRSKPWKRAMSAYRKYREHEFPEMLARLGL